MPRLNHRIRKVAPAGAVSTDAGSGTAGYRDGSRSATLTVDSDVTDPTVALSGTGTGRDIAVTDNADGSGVADGGSRNMTNVDLGSATLTSTKSFRITNPGTAPLTITNITIWKGESSYSPADIPSTSTPNNFIAPFWTDLYPAPGYGQIIYATRGTAPNRVFIVKWDSVAEYGNTAKRVSFQVLLYENSNSIEIQYENIDPGFGTSHSVAMGLESADYGSTQPQPAANVVGLKYGFGNIDTGKTVFGSPIKTFGFQFIPHHWGWRFLRVLIGERLSERIFRQPLGARAYWPAHSQSLE